MRYRIGLNIGTTSCGWSVIRHNESGEPINIENLGVRMFEIAENPKDGLSLAKARKETRSIRRRVRRRKHRIDRVKNLLIKYNILTEEMLLNLYTNSNIKNIYELRVQALDEKLNNEDLAKVLLNMVKKRGYKSNVELEEYEKDEDGKVITATKENQRIMNEKGYRTVAEMYLKDYKFKIILPDNTVINKIRNTTGKYHSTVLRNQIREELVLILDKQNKLNPVVTNDFISKYLEIFDLQRPYDEGTQIRYSSKQVDKMLGKCIFEKQENRAVKASYSYEYFELLKQLNNIIIEKTIINNNMRKVERRKLTKEEREKIVKLVKYQSKIRYSDIRQELNLSTFERFSNIEYNSITEFSESVNKSAERKPKIEGFVSYFRLKQALYYVNNTLIDKLTIEELDEIAYILTVYKSNERRMTQFEKRKIDLPHSAIQELLKISFVEISYLSLKAINKITPYLEQGLTYNNALNKAYPYIETHVNDINNEILNPVTRRAVSQTIKVLNAIINKYGNPDLINIEFTNELGKSKTDREKINKLKQENLAKTNKIKEELLALEIDDVSGKNIAKYKLWKEQSNYCIYSGKKIDINSLFTDETSIDYIIPFWMCFDDTYKNKVLTLTSEVKQKKNTLPYQYIKQMKRNIEEYEVRVSMLVRAYGKRSRLMKSDITKEEIISWRNRNIQDTQYIGKWMYNYIINNIKFTECNKYNKKVLIVSPNLTSYINKRLDIVKNSITSNMKYALNAITTSIVSRDMLNQIISYTQTNKENTFPRPWENFKDNLNNLPPIFISRAPRRKVTGAAHDETIRRMKMEENSIKCISRTDIKKLKLNANGEIDGFSEESKKCDKKLYNAIKEKIQENGGDASRAFITDFYKPKKDNTPGMLVKKVKIESKTRLPIQLKNKAIATNGTIIRIDIFKVEGDGYYFVPIYVSDTVRTTLPNKACMSKKQYNEWAEMKEEDFIFSLYPKDLVYIKSKTPINLHPTDDSIETMQVDDILAYYIRADISSASISIINNDNTYATKGLGIKTLLELKKYEVDMLGNYHEVHLPEKRLKFNHKKD